MIRNLQRFLVVRSPHLDQSFYLGSRLKLAKAQDEFVAGSRVGEGGAAMERFFPPLAFAGLLYFGIGLLCYLGWLEKLLRPVRGRGERRRDSHRKIRICRVIFIILVLLGGLVREERIQSIPGQARRLDQRDIVGRISVRRMYDGNWVQPHHLLYLHHLRSCASSAWGLVNTDSSPLQPTEWNRGLGAALRFWCRAFILWRCGRGSFAWGMSGDCLSSGWVR